MVASIALCFIPLIAVYLCFAILVKDFNKWTGLLSCLLGLVAFVPIIAIDFVKDPYLGGSQFSQLMKFLLLALVEEGIKMVLMFFLPAKKSSQLSFVSYAILLGMTLGCFETLLYLIVIVPIDGVGYRWWAIIIHSICAGLSGIFVYSIKKKNLLIIPFLFAVLFHGVYNYFADFMDFRKYFALAVMLIAMIELKLRYEVLKSDLGENKISDNLENYKSKGDPKKMGLKDFVKGLFGKKDEKNDVPEQSVFSSPQTGTSDSSSEKTEEAVGLSSKKEDTVVSTVVSTAEKVVATTEKVAATTSTLLSSKEEKPKEEKTTWGSMLSKEPVKFVDDPVVLEDAVEEVPVPAPLKAEPVAEEKPAEVKKPRTAAKSTAKDSETKSTAKKATTTKKSATEKSSDEKKSATTKKTAAKASAETSEAPKKRGRKPSAEKKVAETVASTPAKRGRKPAASKTVAEEKKSEETKTSAAKTTKTAATKTSEKKPAATKTTAKKTTAKASDAKAETKTAAKKSTATKTTAKKSTTVSDTKAEETKTPAKRGRKPAALKDAVSETVAEVKSTAKKASTTAKKVAESAEKTTEAVKKVADTVKKTTAAKSTTKKAAPKADGEKAPAKKTTASKTSTKKVEGDK